MKLNSPIPQTLSKECSKAARIFKSFVDGSNNGLDGVIPRSVLGSAKGFAIFTIFKAGFLFSARAGSGVVIARLDDGRWSAPSAIGTAGLGVGGQAGAEMTDFLVVLNTRKESLLVSRLNWLMVCFQQTFMAAGSLTLGGNLSIALGPLGRNGEALGSLNTSGKVAAIYSKTRGLFGGISVEGSVIVERQDANHQAYHSPVTARMLLGGVVDPPEWASYLIHTLESCTGMPGGRKWVQDGHTDGIYAFGGLASPGIESSPSFMKKKSSSYRQRSSEIFPPDAWGNQKDSGSYFESQDEASRTRHGRVTDSDQDAPSSPFDSPFDNPKRPRFISNSSNTTTLDRSYDNPARHSRSYSAAAPHLDSSYSDPLGNPGKYDSRTYRLGFQTNTTPRLRTRSELIQQHESVGRAIALYDFKAVESGDLSFTKGDVITILKKSDSSDDWWTGKCGNRQGLFPANRVEVI
ncbi:hypothetical protein C0995_014174 [Termitomyces sp. Mi166|nr:hypothetical protein C0995_014174 [Termitomyces sp. Mi166\